MIILEVLKNKQHLMRIVTDSNGEILIDKDIFRDYNLKPDCEISDEKMKEIIFQSDYYRAKSRCVWYLDRKDCTKKALMDKLRLSGFPKEASLKAIERLEEVGLVDDLRFANRYAERCIEANISKREVYQKLYAKGVTSDMIKEVLAEIEPDEEEQIKAVIDKKYYRKLEDENGVQKVYAALIRKGFSFSAVKKVLKQYSQELEYSEE